MRVLILCMLLTGCKTVNIDVHNYPASGDVVVEVEITGSDVELKGKLK